MQLIITDMDGTLLKPNGEIPSAYFDLMQHLKPHDIKFGVASGRQYGILKELFKHDYQDMIIISDNGAAVYNGKQLVYKHCLTKELVLKYRSVVQQYPYFGLIYAGVNSSYTESLDPEVGANLKIYCHFPTAYPSIDKMLEHDEVAKMAIYDFSGKASEHIANFAGYDDVDFVVSGEHWIDITAKNTSKGQALKYLKQQYGIAAKDIYAFGDYNNDITLLQEAENSYAMANATPEVKATAHFSCPSNAEEGVIKTLAMVFKEYL